MMKVSVIIPVYNVENYVADCIRSVLRQTYSNIEIVIVDDCTKDNSMEVVAGVLDSEKTTSDVHIVRPILFSCDAPFQGCRDYGQGPCPFLESLAVCPSFDALSWSLQTGHAVGFGMGVEGFFPIAPDVLIR